MPKPKTITIENLTMTNEEITEEINNEPIFLKDEAIYFPKQLKPKTHSKIPPPTPDYPINCEKIINVPEIHLSQIEELPKVKEEGIKFTIENLGQQLGLGNYEYDLIQFWLLDILTDCVWKAQEVFKFKDTEQMVVLNWCVAFFKIIADPILNITRKDFLHLFKEVLLESYKTISKQCEFPSVDLIDEVSRNYFSIEDESDESGSDEESVSSTSSSDDSGSSFSIKTQDKIIISPQFDIKEHIRRLKKENPLANAYHSYSETNPFVTKHEEVIGEEPDMLDYRNLLNVESADRFDGSLEPLNVCIPPYICTCLDSTSEEEGNDTVYEQQEIIITPANTEESTSTTIISEQSIPQQIKNLNASSQILNYLSKGKFTEVFPKPCMKAVIPPDIFTIPEPVVNKDTSLTEEELEKIQENEIMNEWAYFLMMEQRKIDMDDPRVGWVPWITVEVEKQIGEEHEKEVNFFDENEKDLVVEEDNSEKFKPDEKVCGKGIVILFRMLKAIVDFVFEYFYENFHFTVIKLAFRSTPFTISQELNTKWLTPKVIKEAFKRPKPAKKKKEKKHKEKKPKKDKKKKKSDKKSESSKDKKKGKKGKDKKKKPEKISKAEKARLKALAELEEAERIKREEDRVFMFPLADAASETLFMSIFENWVKAATDKKKGKKDKKGKKGKKK